MQSQNDFIQKFYFPAANARGAIVKLSNSFIESLNGHDYPDYVNQLLGESLAAATLLSSHLKFASRFTFQAQGSGPISLLFAEAVIRSTQQTLGEQGDSLSIYDAASSHSVRAFARLSERQFFDNDKNCSLDLALGKSTLAMTVERMEDDGASADRYQSIIESQQPSLSGSLKQYFVQSEQLPTQIKLAVNSQLATGMLLQQMPNTGGIQLKPSAADHALWQELDILANTLTSDELLSLPAENILHRLFHEHDYRLYPAEAVTFACSCSQQRSANALKSLPHQELQAMLDEDGEIVIDCEFCSAKYRFGQAAIDAIFQPMGSSKH